MIVAVVVNYRCADLTARAAFSVIEDCPDAELIVVDNSACNDETKRLREMLPARARLIVAPENLGFGAANELALAASSGDPVLLLNPDAYVLPGCLARLVNTLAARPDVGAVAPMIWWDRKEGFALPPGQMESPVLELWRALSPRSAILTAASTLAFRARSLAVWKAREPVSVSMLSGAAMMLSRAAILRAGGLFDRQFFMYYEDTDLSRRLRAAGLSLLIDPQANAVHAWRADGHNVLMADGRRCYMDKHFRGSRILRLVEWTRVGSPRYQGPAYTDLGPLDRPPHLFVPPSWQSSWLFEVSPAPSFIPAAGLMGTGPELRLSEEWWRNLAPGRYFARLGPARTWVPRGQCLSWQVGQGKSEPAQSEDLLSALSHTLASPVGAAVSLPSQFPRPSLKLANRFGLEPAETDSDRYLKRRQPIWRIEWARPEDEAALRDLFAAAFGHNMPSSLWNWKYGRRQRFGIAVWRGDRAVGYYGWMPRRVRFFGEPMEAAQICDVMTRPEERGALTRQGPFFSAAQSFTECCLGQPPRHPFSFGFPSSRHERLGAKLGIYHEVTRIMEISWPCRRVGRSLSWQIRPMARNPRDSMIANGLWRRMAQSLTHAVVGERDAAYLRYRFLDHPVIKYTVLLVRQRWAMRPWGIVVLRDHGPWMELVDVVAPVQRMPALIGAARRFAGNAGKAELRGWITEEFTSTLRSPDTKLTATDITVPLGGIASTPARRSQGRWFLTAGDTDFR